MDQFLECVSRSVTVSRTRSSVAWRFTPGTVDPNEEGVWTVVYTGIDSVMVLHCAEKDMYYVRVGNGGFDWVPRDYLDRCLEDDKMRGLFRDLANWVRKQPELKDYHPGTTNMNAQFFGEARRQGRGGVF